MLVLCFLLVLVGFVGFVGFWFRPFSVWVAFGVPRGLSLVWMLYRALMPFSVFNIIVGLIPFKKNNRNDQI